VAVRLRVRVEPRHWVEGLERVRERGLATENCAVALAVRESTDQLCFVGATTVYFRDGSHAALPPVADEFVRAFDRAWPGDAPPASLPMEFDL